MDENEYKEQFEALASGLKTEKVYDALAERAEFIRILIMHCGEIYWAGRKAGLPRKTAAAMVRDYFIYEVTPAGVFVVEGEGE